MGNDQPVLEAGSHGAWVERLQAALAALGYDVGYADGDFGPRTEAAVEAFQQNCGIACDGIAGPATWSSLETFTAVAGFIGGAIDLVADVVGAGGDDDHGSGSHSHGAGGDDDHGSGSHSHGGGDDDWPELRHDADDPRWVGFLHNQLTELGFDVSGDGAAFLAVTDAVVRKFQHLAGLVVDGIVGPRTWSALYHADRASFHQMLHENVHALGDIPYLGESLEALAHDAIDEGVAIAEGVRHVAHAGEKRMEGRAAHGEDRYEGVRTAVIGFAQNRLQDHRVEIVSAVTQFNQRAWNKTESVKGNPPSFWDELLGVLINVATTALTVVVPPAGALARFGVEAAKSREITQAGVAVMGAFASAFGSVARAQAEFDAAATGVEGGKAKLRAEAQRLVDVTIEGAQVGYEAGLTALGLVDLALAELAELSIASNDVEALCDALGIPAPRGKVYTKVLDDLEDSFDVAVARVQAEIKYELADAQQQLEGHRQRAKQSPMFGGEQPWVEDAYEEQVEEAQEQVEAAVKKAREQAESDG